MGSRSSKQSYDIAPVVTNKDFSYRSKARPLPEVKLPEVIVTSVDGNDVNTNGVMDSQIPPGINRIQTPEITSVMVEIAESQTLKPQEPAAPAKDARIPDWVTEENFKPLLIKSYPNFAEIVSFEAYPALAAGENYATLMLRVKITIKLQDTSTNNLSYMLKVAHDTKEMKEMLKNMNFFDVENAVYTDVIPEMEDMYRQVGTKVQFGAQAYELAPEAPKSYYVLLEDLSGRTFKNVNRLECLDMEHTLAVLRKLAQFHAASACRVLAKGVYPETFSVDMDNEMSRGMMQQMFGSFKKPFMENLKTFDNGDRYEDAMSKFFDNVIEEFIYGRKPHPEYLNVLNHGDAWSNNILFHYTSDGKVDEVLFVDFQNTNYSTPAQDLFYFLISSAQVDIKVAQYEYFVRYYHQHLEQNLLLLKYPSEKIPNLRELHVQLTAYGGWATITSFLTMGIVLLDPTDDAKFENFMGEQKESLDFKNSVYANPRYRKYINEVLPWLFNRGFMETHDFDNEIAATDKVSVPTPTPKNALAPKCSYPEWVNETYFDDVIRSDFENYHKILTFDVSPATSAGDNYSSIMLKVDIAIELKDNSKRTTSYMLKIPPAGKQAQVLINLMGSFVKEITAYSEIVPRLENAFKEQANIDVVFGPKSYKSAKDSGCETLILENLRLKGFKNGDRLQGLDMVHTKAVLKKMAQLHAASAYLFETQGHFPTVYERSIYTEEYRNIREKSAKEYYDIFFSCIQQYEGSEEYIDSWKQYIDNSIDCLDKAYTTDFGKFNVLNHGDCWTNNIMFQYSDQGEIANTYFVDFQLMNYGSPAQDLYYFLLSSTKFEDKLEHFDYFINYYHENLKTNLELLKYPKEIPTLRELHMELLEEGVWAIYTSIGVMAAALLEPSDDVSLEELMKSDEGGQAFKRKMFLNQRYRTHAEAQFPWMSRRGLMELNMETTKAPTITEKLKQVNVPSWVDEEHFEDVLKADIENFSKITGLTTVAATKNGDNYGSSLLRVKVEASLTDGTNTVKSYILKLPLESQLEQGMLTLWNFFDKEIAMYSKYLPEFEALCGQYGSTFDFGPKFFKFTKNVGKDILLMEDLGQRGFQCGDRREGLDMVHVKAALEKLAQFHAVSAKYVELNGPFPEIFQKGIYTEETRHIFESNKPDYLYGYFKQFDNNEEYIDKVPNLLDTYVDKGIRDSQVNPAEFNVLNHGDSWLNNIMFRHDNAGNIEQTYFVDYQVCKYGTPAQDLWYFIMSSVELDIKVDSFDYMIRYYHEQLVANLNTLKFAGKVPTLPELHLTMLKYGNIGYSTSIGTTAICLLESSENANITNFSAKTPEGDKLRDLLYLNDKYKAHAAAVFPWLARRGCLD